MKSSLVLMGPSGLSDKMRCGAMVVPWASSPWQRAQFRLNCFQPSYTCWGTVSSGALWYGSRSGAPGSAVCDGAAELSAGWVCVEVEVSEGWGLAWAGALACAGSLGLAGW